MFSNSESIPKRNRMDSQNGSVDAPVVKSENKKYQVETKCTPAVPFYKLFRFATNTDYCLMFIGTLAALSTGPCLSILLILWGEVIEIVVTSAGSSHLKSSEYNANNKSSLLYATFIFILTILLIIII